MRSGVACAPDPMLSGRWNLARGLTLSGMSALPPVLAAQYLRESDYLAWIVAFSLLPWVMISQVGLQPGVLAIVGSLGHDASDILKGTVARVALRMSASQYLLIGLSGLIVIVLLAKAGWLADSLEGLLGHPSIVALLLFAGLLQCLGSVGNAFMVATGSGRPMALLTALGAGLFIVGAGIATLAGPKMSGETLSALVCVGMAAPTIGVLRALRNGRYRPGPLPVPSSTQEDIRSQLHRFMGAQAVWVVPGVLITGLDNILVTEFDPSSVRVYSVSLAVLALAGGATGAIASPFISHLAGFATVGGGSETTFGTWDRIKVPLTRLSRMTFVISAVAFSSCLLLLLAWLWWQPSADHPNVALAIPLLAAGLSIRILTVPLSILAISARRQRSLFPSAIGEAVVNASASLLLGYHYGAVGVAGGTFLGSLAAISLHGWAALHLLKDVPIQRRWWLQSVLVPATVLSLAGLATTGALKW